MREFTMKTYFGRSKQNGRTLTPKIGERYVVSPMNPQKKKHRGRTCVIEAFNAEYMPDRATVRFDDNNRLGKVDLSDLVPCKVAKLA